MKIPYIKLCLLSLLLFSACDDELQIGPLSSISVNSFFQNEDDARSAANGMYVQMRSIGNSLYLYGDERSEQTTQTDLGTGNDVNRNAIQPTTGGTDWAAFYNLLKDINLVLANVPGIEFVNEQEKENILAQAYFLRAWSYFMIARIWGDAPLITIPFESPDQEGLFPDQRDPVSALFTQIKADIEQALSLFPEEGVGNRYIASKPAANLLKTDVYLWTAKQAGGGNDDFNTALAAVNEVIGHPDLRLLDDYAAVFRPTTATAEDIFSIYWDLVEDAGTFFASRYNVSDSFYGSLSPNDQARIPFIRNSVRFYTSTELFRERIIANAALGNGEPDPRAELYFLSYTDPSGEQRHIMNKYQGEEISGNQRQFTDDYKIYRYADAILMRAEILNALGNTDEAIADLNLIRNRAGIGDYQGENTSAAVDAAILSERGVEFAYEGKRWWDLVRFGKAYELVPNLVGRENAQPILWPISINTMALNPRLQQTPGY